MKSLALLVALGAAFIGPVQVYADTTQTDATEEIAANEATIWRETQPTYEFKHPMSVTCEEFIDTEQVYQPYVVAWLSGRTIGVLDVGDPDEFVPVSVPQIVELCTEQPDEMVWELVKTQ